MGMHSHILGYPSIWGIHSHKVAYPCIWECIPIYWGTPVHGMHSNILGYPKILLRFPHAHRRCRKAPRDRRGLGYTPHMEVYPKCGYTPTWEYKPIWGYTPRWGYTTMWRYTPHMGGKPAYGGIHPMVYIWFLLTLARTYTHTSAHTQTHIYI
jgi:hypothetical protein